MLTTRRCLEGYIGKAGAFLLVCVLVGFGIWAWGQWQEAMWSKRIASCTQAEEAKNQCYANVMRDAVHERGLVRAFEVLAEIVEVEGEVRSESDFFKACHAFTHELGEEAYDTFRGGGTIPLLPYADLCSYGFYHGFMETLVHEGGTAEEARHLCDVIEEKAPAAAPSIEVAPCYHGIGHGAVDGAGVPESGGPEDLLKIGKKFCDFVGGADESRIMWCLTGSFHSLAHMYEDETHGLSISSPDFDPYGICNLQPRAIEKKACYQQMRSVAMAAAGQDFRKALSYVRQIEEEEYARAATDGLAEHEAQLFRSTGSEEDYRGIGAACLSLPEALSTACVQAFGAGLVMYGIPGREHEGALTFCSLDALGESAQYICMHRILLQLQKKSTMEQAERVCLERVEPRYPGICVKVVKAG